jgi:hypothetical protein
MSPANVSRLKASITRSLSFRVTVLPISTSKNVVNATIPSPPSCIRTRITTLPNKLQCIYVGNIVIPITQTADVEEKSASKNGVGSPSAEEIGRHKNNVPINIATKKLAIMSILVENIFFFFFGL